MKFETVRINFFYDVFRLLSVLQVLFPVALIVHRRQQVILVKG